KHAKLHAAVLDKVADDLGLALGHVERDPLGGRDARGEEEDEGERLRDDSPLGIQPKSSSPWARAISCKLSEPYHMTTPMIEAPMAISAEIMSAAARWPPRRAKLLPDAQPAIITPYTPSESIANT